MPHVQNSSSEGTENTFLHSAVAFYGGAAAAEKDRVAEDNRQCNAEVFIMPRLLGNMKHARRLSATMNTTARFSPRGFVFPDVCHTGLRGSCLQRLGARNAAIFAVRHRQLFAKLKPRVVGHAIYVGR